MTLKPKSLRIFIVRCIYLLFNYKIIIFKNTDFDWSNLNFIKSN